jgi:sterol desaturase/sphingolipid hydroxylase (fatty acid hydroxylase superfamily)
MLDSLRDGANVAWDTIFEDGTRYVVFSVAAWAIVCVALKKVLAGRKIRPDSPKPRQMVTEFLISIRSIFVYSLIGIAIEYMARAGLYPLSALSAGWGPAWFAISLLLMIVGHDAYFYWVHRLIHHPKRFRKYHFRHHLSHNPSPFSAYSFDLREAALMGLFAAIWPLFVPTPWVVIPVWLLHQLVRNTIGHCGYELMPAGRDGRPLFDWLTTVTHHDLHHAYSRHNFGLYFTWWDRWMGTEHPEYHTRFARAVRRELLPQGAPVPTE